jgi:hypothetical protein
MTKIANLWSFVVVADPHLREDDPFVIPHGGEGLTALTKFRRVLQRAQQLQPQFMMLLGDLHVDKFEPLLPEIPMPIHVVFGNHEKMPDRARLRELFANDFGDRDFYTFEQNDTLFICVCNAVPGDHVGYFESQRITPNVGQLAWLEEQLIRGQQYQHCIVFGHVPPSPDGEPHQDHLTFNDAQWLRQRVEKYHPTALFFGHRHQHIWFDIAETPVYSLRSCNWNFDAEEPTGFLHVTIFPERIDVKFINTLEV